DGRVGLGNEEYGLTKVEEAIYRKHRRARAGDRQRLVDDQLAARQRDRSRHTRLEGDRIARYGVEDRLTQRAATGVVGVRHRRYGRARGRRAKRGGEIRVEEERR